MHLNTDAPQQMLPDSPLAPPLAPPTDTDEETEDNMAVRSTVIVVKVRRGSSETDQQASLPHPSRSAGLPQVRPLHLAPQGAPEAPAGHRVHPAGHQARLIHTMEALCSSMETDRSISPFYMSSHLSPVHCRPDVANSFLERTIRSAVEQHLFDSSSSRGQSSEDDLCPPAPSSPPAPPSARQRHRQQRQKRQQDRRSPSLLQQNPDKENLLSVLGEDRKEEPVSGGQGGGQGPPSKTRTPKPCCARGPLLDNQHTLTRRGGASRDCHRAGGDVIMESQGHRSDGQSDGLPVSKTLSMKIQESPEPGRTLGEAGRTLGEAGRTLGEPERSSCEDVPRLTALTEDSDWGEPAPAYSSWQRESMDRDEARLSPHPGGRLIRQLVEEEGDPMLSPRSYAYGHSQHYLDDTEVPPSPPNAHSFSSRRRSSSLGSCDDEREELTSAQLSKKIHGLKRKIRKYEEKFEDERKYRPSHSDKAGNPEVLRWTNELATLRKDLKESRLMRSEEDLPPLTRQRSNTLPRSFGSQLEKKPPQERPPQPPVEATLGAVQSRLEEKREEVGRPDDIKDMTREQIGAEKVALQKALLYYEGIHGRPITKSERLTMKPLYDRYRLVKQILCRASTIPVIEEEDGSEDEGDFKPPSCVTERPELSMLGFLEQLEEEGFISPVDELSPSRSTTDMRLSNLHSATMEELVVQLQEAREEKKRIRKNLREFEDQFFRQNGRNVQKEDRSPLAVEYNEYKHVKAKLRLLEVLISKRDSSKFI